MPALHFVEVDPVTRFLAQSATPELCDEQLLCSMVLERTGNETAARIAAYMAGFFDVVAILVLAYLISWFLRRFVTRFAHRMEAQIAERLERAHRRGAISDAQRFRTRRFQRLNAVVGVLRGGISAVVWVIALFAVLARLDVPLQPIATGAGLAGILIGFGAQQLIRDVLSGIAMLIEDQYGVGDWIEVEGKVGEVERVGLRSTAFRDMDGTVHHVLNGYLQRVGNLSQGWARSAFDVPLALGTDIPTARSIIWKVATELTDDPVWGPDAIGPPEIWGVQHFGPEGLAIRVVIPTKPLRNYELTRQLRERLKNALQEAGIRMPGQLIDIVGRADGRRVDDRAEPAENDESATVDASPGTESKDTDEHLRESPARDQTQELRLEFGPRPRPD